MTRLLEKQRRRMEARGIAVDMETLRRDWERKQSGDHDGDDEIDVVGSDDDDEDDDDDDHDEEVVEEKDEAKQMTTQNSGRLRSRSSFSIDSLLGGGESEKCEPM